MLRIAIVDDHPIVVKGLKDLLEMEPEWTVVGCFHTGNSLLAFMADNEADIILLDISLPDTSGIRLCKEIRRRWPDTQIVAVSNLSDRSIIQQMLQQGAGAYILKTATPEEVTQCITEVMGGNIFISKEVQEIISRPGLNAPATIPELTKREKQILQLLAEGKRSADIAAELFISPLTVKTHRATLLQKFGVSNMVALVKSARELQLI
ncbi:response regulator [Chitinophaga qingshengii]|uniref:Response regulator transcription factor n=1 Tax=Chitinophaga qingshengii TaxID=1569794 RepID=A0ABR7TQQ8_9BACT|nr:response regulator transcription factor [Chitinophaga qingshengii]MBC9932824.1 response regulator transcription factor [Chitinophaga qingshengii]